MVDSQLYPKQGTLVQRQRRAARCRPGDETRASTVESMSRDRGETPRPEDAQRRRDGRLERGSLRRARSKRYHVTRLSTVIQSIMCLVREAPNRLYAGYRRNLVATPMRGSPDRNSNRIAKIRIPDPPLPGK